MINMYTKILHPLLIVNRNILCQCTFISFFRMEQIYLFNKNMYKTLFSYEQTGCGKKVMKHLDNNEIKNMHQDLIKETKKIYEKYGPIDYYQNNISMIKSQLFSLSLVLFHYKKVVYYGNTVNDMQPYKHIMTFIKKLIKKYKLNVEITRFCSSYEYFVVHDKKYTNITDRTVFSNHTKFVDLFSDLDVLDDRIVQIIYAYGYQFYTQICLADKFEQNKNKFDTQLQKYQQFGNILGIELNQEFKKLIGVKTLLKCIVTNGVDEIRRHKDELIYLFQVQEKRNKKTEEILNTDNLLELQKKESVIKMILTSMLIDICDINFININVLVDTLYDEK